MGHYIRLAEAKIRIAWFIYSVKKKKWSDAPPVESWDFERF